MIWMIIAGVVLGLAPIGVMVVYQLQRRAALRTALHDMSLQRNDWVEIWKKNVSPDTSAPADTCRAALASVAFAQHHASADWLHMDSTDVVLNMEWFADRALSNWVRQKENASHEQAYLVWRAAWANQRAWVNHHAQSHNQVFAHTPGRLLARVCGWNPATDWVEEATHRHRLSLLRDAINAAD